MMTIWNINDSNGIITLSNSNWTAKIDKVGYIKSDTLVNSGLIYMEYRIITKGHTNVGIANVSGNGHGTNTDSRMLYQNGTLQPTGDLYNSGFNNGDIVSMLIDFDNNMIEFWINGITGGVEPLNLTGDLYAIIRNGGTSTITEVEANFGQSTFAYEMPQGYASFDGSQKQIPNKTLILSGGNYYKFDGTNWIDLGIIPADTTIKNDLFTNEGMDDISILNSTNLSLLGDSKPKIHTRKPL